ncbi:hypothetical protein [Erwinia phage FBB1]|nr:hypothetical protein [Erwinia phage FBB1]
MKFTANLNLSREQLNNLIHFVSYRVITRDGNNVVVVLDGEAGSISRILSQYADKMQQKIFKAKAAIEDLYSEVEKLSLHNCGAIKSVIIPLELEGKYVTDHCTLFERSKSHQGIEISSYIPD